MTFCSCSAAGRTGLVLNESMLAVGASWESEMPKRIYVGNLPFSASEDDIRQLFEQHGTVHSVALVTDRDTGRPRGFGFVELGDEDADKAIQQFNGTELDGRALTVNEARPQVSRDSGGGGRGGRGGYNRY